MSTNGLSGRLSGLRTRLLLLLLAALLPAFALLVHSAVERRDASVDAMRRQAREIANDIAAEELGLTRVVRQLLALLVRLPPIGRGDPETFRRFGQELLREDPRLMNIGRVDSDGDIVASVLPFDHPVNISDRPYFRKAVQTGAIAISDYQIGRISGRASLNFAYPVPDADRGPRSILFVSMDLSRLNREQALQAGHVPPGGLLARVDAKGTVFAVYPEEPAILGARFPVPEVVAALRPDRDDPVEATGSDGVRRLHFISRIDRQAGTGEGYIVLGIPRSLLFGTGDRLFLLRLAALAVVTLAGLAAAWFGGQWLLVRPVRAMLDAARRFGAGDLSARAGLGAAGGELGTLAEGFDRMAEAVQQREEALRTAQQLYRTLVETSPDAVVMTDPEGRIRYVSATALRMFGGDSPEDALGMSVLEWVHPDELPRAAENVRSRLVGGTFPETEYRMRRKDGSEMFGAINSSPLFDAEGRVTGLISTIRDVTDRKRQMEALRESELRLRAASARFEALLESSPIAVVVVAAGGEVRQWNRAAEEISGWSREEVIGRTLPLPEAGGGEAGPSVRDRLLAGEEIRGEHLRTARKDGLPVDLNLYTVPLPDPAGKDDRFLLLCEDITARLAAEARREELEAQLLQSAKMEAVGQLAGGVAHDFNNLMTVILGQVDLLRKDGPSPSQRSRIEEIANAGERAAMLTRQLLAFSRRQLLKPEALDLNDAVEDMRALLDRLIGEHYSLDFRPGESLWRVLADPTQIGQVLVNLVVNARDALPDGGRITVETGNVPGDGPARPAALPPGDFVRLSVVDRGAGMDEETRSRIFEPFFTTKEVGKGTGLGMATVYGIIMQSGGHIEVKSTPGDGTRIDVFLPRSTEARISPGEAPGGEVEEPPHGDATLLLVEDAGHVRALVKEILEEYGYTVLEAGNGAEALQVAAAHDGPIDLLLSDVVMPEMGGKRLVEEILPIRPGLRVLYMSGYAEDTAIRTGGGGDGCGFLQKPFTPEALGWKVHELLSKRGG